MSNEELAKYGMQLCEFDGDCDFCTKYAADGDYFWLSTSYEYVEGGYYCRACAEREAQSVKVLEATGHRGPRPAVLQWSEAGND